MNDLPEFRKMKRAVVMDFINPILSGPSGNSLLKLIEFDDNHYRAVFRSTYFALQDDVEQPSKSQWNTLKKKVKRRNKSVFVFRVYGKVDCKTIVEQDLTHDCLYFDFGFMR